jgi:hypothetical protein
LIPPDQSPFVDFYDISNVDGFNVAVSIETFGGQQIPGFGDNPKFNCGNPGCTFNMDRCPEEVTYIKGGKKYCMNLCLAVHNYEMRSQKPFLMRIFNDPEMLSKVCCDCWHGADPAGCHNSICNVQHHADCCGCFNPSSKHCCSPYDHTLAGKNTGGTCRVEEWPKVESGYYRGQQFNTVFKDQCPDAYSWQFDDLASTYQCKDSNYRITFCGNGGNKPNPKPATDNNKPPGTCNLDFNRGSVPASGNYDIDVSYAAPYAGYVIADLLDTKSWGNYASGRVLVQPGQGSVRINLKTTSTPPRDNLVLSVWFVDQNLAGRPEPWTLACKVVQKGVSIAANNPDPKPNPQPNTNPNACNALCMIDGNPAQKCAPPGCPPCVSQAGNDVACFRYIPGTSNCPNGGAIDCEKGGRPAAGGNGGGFDTKRCGERCKIDGDANKFCQPPGCPVCKKVNGDGSLSCVVMVNGRCPDSWADCSHNGGRQEGEEESQAEGLSGGAKAGIAIGVIAGCIALVAVVGLIAWKVLQPTQEPSERF